MSIIIALPVFPQVYIMVTHCLLNIYYKFFLKRSERIHNYCFLLNVTFDKDQRIAYTIMSVFNYSVFLFNFSFFLYYRYSFKTVEPNSSTNLRRLRCNGCRKQFYPSNGEVETREDNSNSISYELEDIHVQSRLQPERLPSKK